MVANNVDSRLQKAMQERAALESKIRRLKSMQSTEARRADARRKIVVGAAILSMTKADPDFKKLIARILHERVTAARDRELLGLPPLASEGTGNG